MKFYIPLLNGSTLHDGNDGFEEYAKMLGEALEQGPGIIRIANPPIDWEMMQSAHRCAQEVMRFAQTNPPTNHSRGFRESKTFHDTNPDVPLHNHRVFQLGHSSSTSNIWPEGLPLYVISTLNRYFGEMFNLFRLNLKAIEAYADQLKNLDQPHDQDFFRDSRLLPNESVLRIIQCDALTAVSAMDADKPVLAQREVEARACLVLLNSLDAAGLEVWLDDTNSGPGWHAIDAQPGEIVVFGGSMLWEMSHLFHPIRYRINLPPEARGRTSTAMRFVGWPGENLFVPDALDQLNPHCEPSQVVSDNPHVSDLRTKL